MKRVFVTGGGGFLGRGVVRRLAGETAQVEHVVSGDLREMPPDQRLPGVAYVVCDVRSSDFAALFAGHRIDTVVHLAAIVTPGGESNREFEYAVDVAGTERVLRACIESGVSRIVVSSSGAAYGYHADNPAWISEDQPLRGNEVFAYSHHKRLVEELLARYRLTRPQLQQVVFRIGTILGANVDNQITALFERPRILAIRGADSPFVFVWDEDVADCMLRAVLGTRTGIFNVAGDGALTIREIAAMLGKPALVLPAALLRIALAVGRRLGVTRYGPEQLDFLRYRPVLDNARLKAEFGYTPRMTSRQAFEAFIAARGWRRRAANAPVDTGQD